MATKKKAVVPSFDIKPIKKNIILEAIKKDTVSKGGIIMQSADAEEATRGKILATGPEVTIVSTGQVVLPNWQKAKKVKYEASEYWIVNEDDLVLVFEGE
jgi:chaperonin GroES